MCTLNLYVLLSDARLLLFVNRNKKVAKLRVERAENRLRRRAQHVAICAVLLGIALARAACAADVFLSVAADGTPQYATQALDTSYLLALREELAQPVPTAANPRVGKTTRSEHLQAIIQRVARRHGMSPALVHAVASVESNLNPTAVSMKGSQGAMQLTPATGARYGLSGPHAWRDPARNIDAGARHLKDLLARYRGNVPLALAAYNAGPGAVDRHRHRIPPYRETMLYVPSVLAKFATLSDE